MFARARGEQKDTVAGGKRKIEDDGKGGNGEREKGRDRERGIGMERRGGKSTVAKVRKKGIRSIDSRTFVAGVTPFSSQAFILDQTTPRRLLGVEGGA